MVEGVLYCYQRGVAWRDLPKSFGKWQTVWTWHLWMAFDDTWDTVLARLSAHAEAAGQIDRSLSVGSTIARTHQHVTNIKRLKRGLVPLHKSGHQAA